MKKGVIIAIVLGVIFLSIIGWFIIHNDNEDVVESSDCSIENPDPNGYLLKICEYLKQHENTIIPNKAPDDYSIKTIEDGGNYLTYDNGVYLDNNVLVVRLDCCGTGDLAYIDKESKEVKGFSPGDI